jgi:hypothetical protein
LIGGAPLRRSPAAATMSSAVSVMAS